jgi:hypothetical protein
MTNNRLRHQTPTPGTFVLESSTVRISKIALQTAYKKSVKAHRPGKDQPILVKIPKDPLALDVQLHQPRRSQWMRPYETYI